MVGDKPCEYEKFVRLLATSGLGEDSCRQLDKLIQEGKAQEVKEHLSSWLKTCAQELLDRVAKSSELSDLVQIRDPEPQAVPTADERFEVLADAIDYALGHSRKAKNHRKKIDALRPKKKKD